jgi:comEA protein
LSPDGFRGRVAVATLSYGRGMPFRRAQPPPDLARVARILGDEPERGGWVPVLPALPALPAPPVSSSSRAGSPQPSALDELDADLRRARRPGVVTTPEPLQLGRWSVSTATVVALIALVVAVGCVFAVRVLWAERSAGGGEPMPVAAGVPRVSDPTSSGTPAARPLVVAVEIVVHVVGQVVRPGLVRLQQGSRVADAIAAAGGARPGADVAALNLARAVVDGEQLHVPKRGEVVTPPAPPPAAAGGASAGGGSGTGQDAGGSPAVVSLNTADLAALDTLPGVGPVLAQRIVDWRAEHGHFTSVDELGEVSGIGDKLLARLRPRVSL